MGLFTKYGWGITARVMLKENTCVDCPYLPRITMLLQMRNIDNCHTILTVCEVTDHRKQRKVTLE